MKSFSTATRTEAGRKKGDRLCPRPTLREGSAGIREAGGTATCAGGEVGHYRHVTPTLITNTADVSPGPLGIL